MDERDEPKLQAPGAGLPPLERLLAGAGLAGYAAVASSEQILGRFRTEAEKAVFLVAALGEEAAKTRVLIRRTFGIEDSSRNWSAAMTLEHLSIVTLAIAHGIEVLCSPNADQALAEVRIEDVKPLEDAGLEQIERLETAVEKYAQTIRGIESLRSEARHPHPWFGPLDARGWHALAAIHNTIHRRQIQAIVRKLR